MNSVPTDPIPASPAGRNRRGKSLAVGASALLLLDGLLIVATAATVASASGFQADSLTRLIHESPLPIVLYGIWALGIFGTIAAIVSIALFGFRARWFWRCLVVAAALWLVFPPVHMVIGLVALVVLLRSRRSFSHDTSPMTAAP